MLTDKAKHYLQHMSHCCVDKHSSQATHMVEVDRYAQGVIVQFFAWEVAGEWQRVCFRAYGDAVWLAGAEFCCEWLAGKALDQVSYLTSERIAAALDLAKEQAHVADLLSNTIRKLADGDEREKI